MSITTALESIGVGIDTARYGHLDRNWCQYIFLPEKRTDTIWGRAACGSAPGRTQSSTPRSNQTKTKNKARPREATLAASLFQSQLPGEVYTR